jgi:hypothetical protein
MAEELIPGWEIVERQAPSAVTSFFGALAQMFMLYHPPVVAAATTFVLRNTDSGETRKVTASSVEEAQLRVAKREFD